ncbi:hypothetical protein EDC64_11680 [Aquabacter spiritensis]|uniref:Uncharacterized protein n=1 Tax=Aquabacter spiritensis TaxID=933073 RepID=A0A4R3LNZ2_9HYPH|nr:hypothetical protein EDC64_11680 [Aquabacter spiritensis]
MCSQHVGADMLFDELSAVFLHRQRQQELVHLSPRLDL